ncbi:MAG: heavy metal-associated domain-containing protein [Lutibacter sp.]|uniref:heavy-metal-associated domain-containing protein n=1 Tax=Lutibacter sp. TaxID=1925666 RepID=UPI00385A0BB7
MEKYLSILIVFFVLFSCNETKKENIKKDTDVKSQEIAAVYQNLEVKIEGMTCEIGCARLIESKLSKVEGITYSNVDFETKTGQFTYDTNKINTEDIVKKIGGIAGGDLYKVVKTTKIDSITKKN